MKRIDYAVVSAIFSGIIGITSFAYGIIYVLLGIFAQRGYLPAPEDIDFYNRIGPVATIIGIIGLYLCIRQFNRIDRREM